MDNSRAVAPALSRKDQRPLFNFDGFDTGEVIGDLEQKGSVTPAVVSA